MVIRYWLRLGVLSVIFLGGGCGTLLNSGVSKRAPAEFTTDISASPDYPQILYNVREALKLEKSAQRRPKGEPTETNLIEALQNNPQLVAAERSQLIDAVNEESQKQVDPSKHLRLIPPKGQWGYSELQLFASHPYYSDRNNNKIIQPSNLIYVWSKFLGSAQKQIVLNVFDFDLQIIADVLALKAKSGVYVRVGIDASTVSQRPEVKNISEFLSASGVIVTHVNSVGLNHQKMAAIDWDLPSKAKVLFSSGNLTQSCLNPNGDLAGVPDEKRPWYSIPNANHVITMSSWLLANLVHHELTKTLDPEFHYRGAQFPISGSYQVTGPGVNPFTLEAYPENSLVVTFTPGGGYRNVNKNIISHFLRHSNGPIRMIQFAFSSPEVGETLRNRAIESFQNTQEFDFKSVGDTPFALAEWSQFLKMSGLTLLSNDKKKVYFEDPQNSWVTSLTSDQLHQIRGQVKVAPSSYGIRIYKFGKQPLTVTAKIHHKVMATGPYAIVGTSFNFSKGAEENNEQLLVFRDKKVVQFVHGMTEWLFERSRGSTYSEAMKRNKVKFEDQKAVDASDERIDKSAGKQAPDTADSPPGG